MLFYLFVEEMIIDGMGHYAIHRQGALHIGMHLIGVDGGDRHLYGHAFVLVLLAEGDDIVFDLCIQRSLVVPDLFRNRGAHIGRCGVEERVHELVIGQEGLSVELCRHPLADDGLFHFCLRGNAHFAHGESGGVLAAVFLLAQGGPYHFAFAQGGNFPPFTGLRRHSSSGCRAGSLLRSTGRTHHPSSPRRPSCS